MARAELALRGRKDRDPVMPVIGLDRELGPVDMLLKKGTSGSEFILRHKVKKQGDHWVIQAKDTQDALRIVGEQLGRAIAPSEVEKSGFVDARTFKIEEELDWERARRAVAKVFYAYCLLEFGDRILSSEPMRLLREYFLNGQHSDGLSIEAGAATEPAERFNIPSHHHLLVCDAEDSRNQGVWLFRILWFKFQLELSALGSGGALIGIDPVKGEIVEAAGRRGGTWYERRPVRWGWSRS